jgi:hypothetical protein
VIIIYFAKSASGFIFLKLNNIINATHQLKTNTHPPLDGICSPVLKPPVSALKQDSGVPFKKIKRDLAAPSWKSAYRSVLFKFILSIK